MIFRPIGDLFEIVPPIIQGGIVNRQLPPEEQIYLVVEGITHTESDFLEKEALLDERRFAPAQRLDEQQKRLKDLVRNKVKSVHNVKLPKGELVTDPEAFLGMLDRSMREWLYLALHSTNELTMAERKNFTQPSVSP